MNIEFNQDSLLENALEKFSETKENGNTGKTTEEILQDFKQFLNNEFPFAEIEDFKIEDIISKNFDIEEDNSKEVQHIENTNLWKQKLEKEKERDLDFEEL